MRLPARSRFADCVSGSQQTTSCVQPDVATADGNDSGFEIPRAIAVSPDGASAYGIGSQDAAIIRFSRDPAPASSASSSA